MTEHTSLPWKVVRDTVNWVIIDKNHTVVVASIVDDTNARLIVTACNSHAELLEACEYALSIIQEAIRKAEEQAR